LRGGDLVVAAQANAQIDAEIAQKSVSGWESGWPEQVTQG